MEMTTVPSNPAADLYIENARLSAELRATRDRQAGSAEVVRTIGNISGNSEPCLRQIAEITRRLLDASTVTIFVGEREQWTQIIREGTSSCRMGAEDPVAELQSLPGAVLRQNRQIHVPDIDDHGPAIADWSTARAEGTRTVLGTPLRHQGKAIGVLVVNRNRLAAFAPDETSLLQTFADQAAIAIENARLFTEAREALDRQTATADILKVIASSPSNVQPVFDVIVERAVLLCGARMGRVYRYDGDHIQMVAGHGLSAPGRDRVQQVFPRHATDDTIVGQVMRSRLPFFLPDIREDPSIPALSRQMIEALGTRSQVTMPMLLAGEPIGAITVGWAEPRAYKDQQITLLQTFADQAVIAIENVRLFNETREALERQTATADILKVIASSPSDVQPVFEAIATSANRLIGGFSTAVLRFIGEDLHLAAFTPTNREADEALKASFPRPLSEFPAFVLVRDGETVEFTDTEVEDVPQLIRDMARLRGYRSMLFTPLISAGAQIGLISVTRKAPGSFAAHHVQLVRTFADQAVIAIENVRLFDQVQERTRDLSESLQQQVATADVLKVISRSTFDLNAVLTTLIQSARELCSAQRGVVLLRDKDVYRPAMQLGYPPEFERYIVDHPVVPNRSSGAGRAAFTRQVAHFPDVLADPEYQLDEGQRLGGYRALLSIPLLREGEVVGVFSLGRTEPAPFSERQIELVQTFADQAVIAIENVRLFEQVQARTAELSASLDELRTAQDRLVQTEKLASLGQLTAGIAHEIKNPLNFVNNFSGLSAELTDELNDVLKSAALSDKVRDEVEELTRMLKENLEKVVQHGKRADSIVKNMLLHSREGSGEHRRADINALLDESLNLAYHGARAEKPQFNVTLRRDFDDTAGTLELFPQEITRVFLNLISNGFYALGKRNSQNSEQPFEPLLSAATRNLGNAVEIRIRDNGTGIPPDVREKMFNPFFTTKPAGEGTGLGLSMSHDIVVKQHGGSIDVETKPGQFTEFRIVLPRTSSTPGKN